MKLIFTLLFTLFLTASHAQTRKIAGPITTKHGITIQVGDKIRIGEGSMPSGNYRYLYTSVRVFGEGYLDGGFQYVTAEVVDLQERGSGADRRLVALIVPKGDLKLFKKAADLDRAIDAREIIAVNGVSVSKLIGKKKVVVAQNR